MCHCSWEKKIPLLRGGLEKTWLFHELGWCYLELNRHKESRDYGIRSVAASEETADEKWLINANVLVAQSECNICLVLLVHIRNFDAVVIVQAHLIFKRNLSTFWYQLNLETLNPLSPTLREPWHMPNCEKTTLPWMPFRRFPLCCHLFLFTIFWFPVKDIFEILSFYFSGSRWSKSATTTVIMYPVKTACNLGKDCREWSVIKMSHINVVNFKYITDINA